MEAAKLREILRTEYGISNEKEFDEAVKQFDGIDIGIFSMPLSERSTRSEQITEAKNIA